MKRYLTFKFEMDGHDNFGWDSFTGHFDSIVDVIEHHRQPWVRQELAVNIVDTALIDDVRQHHQCVVATMCSDHPTIWFERNADPNEAMLVKLRFSDEFSVMTDLIRVRP